MVSAVDAVEECHISAGCQKGAGDLMKEKWTVQKKKRVILWCVAVVGALLLVMVWMVDRSGNMALQNTLTWIVRVYVMACCVLAGVMARLGRQQRKPI